MVMVPARGTSNMKLHLFITNHLAEILAEWTAFARKTDPAGTMSDLALRDDAADILQVIAADIETRQSPSAQIEKSQGDAPVAPGSQETAAAIHGRLRHASNFTLLELIAEFRALRATVHACGCLSLLFSSRRRHTRWCASTRPSIKLSPNRSSLTPKEPTKRGSCFWRFWVTTCAHRWRPCHWPPI